MIQPIEPALRDYAWGSTTTIPEMLGMVPTGDPVAEAWFGEMSALIDRRGDGVDARSGRSLADLVAATPGAIGAHREFPFLVKLLAAAEPLSIQVHPDTPTAHVGFHREESAGIASDSPARVYRDRRGKPEAMVALEPFEMLCGFRDPARSIELIEALGVAALADIVDLLRLSHDGLKTAIAQLCTYRPDELSRLITPLVIACAERAPDAHRRQCEWIATIGTTFPDDVGVLFALLLEYHLLEPFDVVFVPPGVIHSYLNGSGLEVMENSDNVVRAGLTPKHIAVDELLRISRFEPGGATIERRAGEVESVSLHRFDEGPFAIDLLTLADEQFELDAFGPEIVLVLDGSAELSSATGDAIGLDRGSAAFVGATTGSYVVSGDARIARVTAVERGAAPRS